MSGSDLTFGPMLRACRLRFVWHARMKAFVRITDDADVNYWQVEFVPLSEILSFDSAGAYRYRIVDDWRELDCSDIGRITGIKTYCIATMDDDGRIVSWRRPAAKQKRGRKKNV